MHTFVVKIRPKSEICKFFPLLIVSRSILTGYIPPGQPTEIISKNLPGGRDLTFESCPGAGNSTRTRILWKMKVKLQKNSVDQIFTGENENKLNFLPFSRFTCFLNGIFPGLWVNYLVLLSHIPYKKCEELPLAGLYLKFSLGYDYPHLLFVQKVVIMLNVLSVYWFYQ